MVDVSLCLVVVATIPYDYSHLLFAKSVPYMAQYVHMKIVRSEEFEEWLSGEPAKSQVLVESRIFRIEHYDHFGDVRLIGGGLAELRWRNGLRVYFSRTDAREVFLIYGGGKNDQKSDIKAARVLLERYTSS